MKWKFLQSKGISSTIDDIGIKYYKILILINFYFYYSIYV